MVRLGAPWQRKASRGRARLGGAGSVSRYRITPVSAAKALRYIEREEQAGRLTDNLRAIRDHRLAFLIRSKCCVHCGTPLSREDSIEEWSLDGLGPKCRANLAAAERRAS